MSGMRKNHSLRERELEAAHRKIITALNKSIVELKEYLERMTADRDTWKARAKRTDIFQRGVQEALKRGDD